MNLSIDTFGLHTCCDLIPLLSVHYVHNQDDDDDNDEYSNLMRIWPDGWSTSTRHWFQQMPKPGPLRSPYEAESQACGGLVICP